MTLWPRIATRLSEWRWKKIKQTPHAQIHSSEDKSATLAATLEHWPTQAEMAEILRRAGLEISVGRYSIRVKTCADIVFREYGGDLGTPCLTADAESVAELIQAASAVSAALTTAQIKHLFEIYDSQNQYVAVICWPEQPEREPHLSGT